MTLATVPSLLRQSRRIAYTLPVGTQPKQKCYALIQQRWATTQRPPRTRMSHWAKAAMILTGASVGYVAAYTYFNPRRVVGPWQV
jgi:hypothetical protein